MYNILLVEDDKVLGESLEESLKEEGFGVTLAKDGNQALDFTYENEFDIYILDVNIPHISGFELLNELRESGDKTPAIFLTALTNTNSLKQGFDVGGDDYIKKPFDFDELLVRINAHIRSSFKSYNKSIIYGELELDIEDELLFKSGKTIHITPTEQKLIEKFLKNIGKVVTIYELIEAIDGDSSAGALRVHITNLKKLGLKLKNIRGVGYICEKL
ncbi:MAG TPA: response regulator transcription factor [Campylobacterales bacterium]|nr:response regulator transcription factor [Campylobacterales bacterium]